MHPGAGGAETAARRNLANKLAKEIDPVPCPDCSRYQTDMAEKLKKGL